MSHAVRLRDARTSTAIAFLLTGFVFATWAARIPARKSDLGLSNGELALAFVGLNAGAVIGLQLGAVAVTRLGSRLVLRVALPLFAAMLIPIAYADGLWWLTVALAASAIVNSMVDVAINDQGVSLQNGYRRSLLSGLHAMHSLGGVAGAGLAALAAAAEWTVRAHFWLVAAFVAGFAVAALRRLLPPASDTQPHSSGTGRSTLLGDWNGRLLLLGGLAFVFTFAEGSGLDWSSVLLRDGRQAPAGVAAAGVAVFMGAISLGRLLGDRAINRYGPVLVFRCGAFLGGGGLVTGLLTGSVAGALAGLALFGLGLATLLPITISAAGATADVPVPVAVARVSTVGYLGSFAGPGVIGLLAEITDLPTAMLVSGLAVAAMALAARAVSAAGGR